MSGISVATRISSVATFATFIGIPVSTALGAASLTGAITGDIISMLTKKVSGQKPPRQKPPDINPPKQKPPSQNPLRQKPPEQIL